MRNALLLLPLIILSLVLAGCGNQEQATTTEEVTSGGEPTSVAVEYQPETSIVEYEVRITE